MYRTLIGIAAAVALALVVVGLTFSTAAEERADFVFVNGTEPKTLDPQKMTGQPEGRIADCVYEGLTYNDPETLKPVPGSATSWDVSPDGLRWTFHLRPEARWSNGDPVTAHDFVFAWVRFQEPEIASEYAYLLHMIRHAEPYNTYGAQVAALRASVDTLYGLAALLRRHPEGVPVAAWRDLVKSRAPEKESERLSAEDRALYERAEGTFTPDEAQRLRDALRRAAERPAAGSILADFDALLVKYPDGIPVGSWQRLAAQRGVASAVVRTPEPLIRDALEREVTELSWFARFNVLVVHAGRAEDPAPELRSDTFTPEEGQRLRQALEREAVRRADTLKVARERFGVDQGVFAPDDHTFVVELLAFTPYFLDLTAFYPTFPVHRPTVEKWPENFFLPGRLVGNGPFLLKSWRIYHRMRLEKSPTYWGRDAVSLRTIDALPIEGRATVLNLYLTGEVDWASSGYPPDMIDKVKHRPDFYKNAGLGVYYYRFNCTRKPFDDPRVREALSIAFDRTELVEQVTRLDQIPAATFVPPGIPGYSPPESRIGVDPERARRLLAEAGYPGGRGFPKTAILYNTDEGHEKIAQYVAAQWKEHLGVDVNAVNQEWQSYQESTRRLDYQIARAAWIGDYRDPNTFLDMWVTNGGNNQTGWSDPLYDRLIALSADPLGFATGPSTEQESVLGRLKDRASAQRHLEAVAAATEPSARVAAAAALRLTLLREAEAILFQQGFPVCPVYFYVYTGLVSPRVEGFYSRVSDGQGGLLDNLQDMHPLRDLRVKPLDGDGRGKP